jgi:hypothetical protein
MKDAGGAPAGMPLFLAGSSSVQRKGAAGSSGDGAEIEADQLAARALSSGADAAAPADSPSRPASAEGAPLAVSTRQFFEGRLGADFSAVRIRTGARADAEARAAGAIAFTKGSDITFRRGEYAPGTSAGRRLLAHELAHVMQQRADAHPRIQREADTGKTRNKDLAAWSFLWKYSEETTAELRKRLQQQVFDLKSPYLSWTGDGASRFDAHVAESIFPDLALMSVLFDLVEVLAPMPESEIVGIVDRVIIDDESEKAVPWVARELMPLILAKTRASLHRIVPRYLAARNQAVLSVPNRSEPSLEPAAGQVPTSMPIDEAVLDALLSGVTAFDELGYRKDLPQEGKPRGDLGLNAPGRIEFLASQGAPQWVRVENQHATAEDVAAVLYGSSTLSYKIVAAAPLFGIQPGSLIEEPYQRLWLESLDAAGLVMPAAWARLGYYPDASALLATPGGAVGDQIIQSQAKGLAATHAGRMDVVQRMRQSLGLADQVIASADKLGITDELAAMRARLDARSRKVMEADPIEAETWGPQAMVQFEILNEAAEGLKLLATKLGSFKPDEAPGYVEEPLRHMAAAYVEAAALSEFAQGGQEQIAVARQLSRSFPLDVLEGKLSWAYASLQSISPDDAEYMGGDTATLIKWEKTLRHGLARTRSLLRHEPARGLEDEKKLEKNVNRLVGRVEAITTLKTIDALFELLAKHPHIMAGEPVEGDESKGIRPINLRRTLTWLAYFRVIWGDLAKTAFSGSEKELAPKLKAVAGQRKMLHAVLKDALLLGKEAADVERWVELAERIEQGVEIAIATMGVGEIAGAIGIGVGLAEGGFGVFLLTTSVESLTAASLNAAESGNWGNFGPDVFWNFVTFGAMKGGSRLFTAAFGAEVAKTTLGAVGEFTTSTVFGTIPALARARLEAGRDLTAAESRAVIRDNFLQNVAFAIGARLFKGALPKLPSADSTLNSRIDTINATRKSLWATANELAGEKSPAEAAIHELANNEAALHAEESSVLKDAEASPHLSKADQAQLETAKHDVAAATGASEATRITPYLEDAGQNQLLCEQGHLDEVKQFYQKPAAGPNAPKPPEVVDLKPDEVTHARRIEVKPTDGSEPFTITEKVPDYEKLRRDLQSRLEDVRLDVVKNKQQAIARGGEEAWNDIRLRETKRIYDILERLHGLEIHRTLPQPGRQRVLYDAKVLGIDMSGTYGGQARNVDLRNVEGRAPRTFDNLVYEPGSEGEAHWAVPVELKSEGAVTSSVKGGLTKGDMETGFRDRLGRQVRTTESLRRLATEYQGTLVVKGRDVITNEEVVIRVEPERISGERVTTYGKQTDVMVPDIPPDDSPPFPLKPKPDPPAPASGAAKPPPKPSPSRTLEDILTQDRKGFTDSNVQKEYEEYVKGKNKLKEKPLDPEDWATATRGSGQKALEKALGRRWRKKRGGKKLWN